MEQSKMESLIESLANIVIGIVVAFISQVIIFKLNGIEVPLMTNMKMTIYFTAVSLVRSYAIRRWFNKRLRSMAHSLSGGSK